jgi:deoxyribonuclease V
VPGLHLALDVHYKASSARGACVAFARPEDDTPAFTLTEQFPGTPGDYEPGMFKKRELPYLEALIAAARTRTAIATILIDGYVWLDEGRPGLGGHLYAALDSTIPIIGVAKSRYHSANAIDLVRGASASPLHITAAGIAAHAAAAFIGTMHGEHRIPTLLKLADRLGRED